MLNTGAGITLQTEGRSPRCPTLGGCRVVRRRDVRGQIASSGAVSPVSAACAARFFSIWTTSQVLTAAAARCLSASSWARERALRITERSSATLPQRVPLKCTSGRPGQRIASAGAQSLVPSAGDACCSGAAARRQGSGRRLRRHSNHAPQWPVVGKKLKHQIEQLYRFCEFHFGHWFDRSRSGLRTHRITSRHNPHRCSASKRQLVGTAGGGQVSAAICDGQDPRQPRRGDRAPRASPSPGRHAPTAPTKV